jgi:hypothetical protein
MSSSSLQKRTSSPRTFCLFVHFNFQFLIYCRIYRIFQMGATGKCDSFEKSKKNLDKKNDQFRQFRRFYFSLFKKGQCHEIFDFWIFSWISFPQASEYTITAISNFFENSQRYSRLKVHHRRHRWQIEKIFKQKYFNNFVWAPLGGRVNIYQNFCLQVHFKVSAA